MNVFKKGNFQLRKTKTVGNINARVNAKPVPHHWLFTMCNKKHKRRKYDISLGCCIASNDTSPSGMRAAST